MQCPLCLRDAPAEKLSDHHLIPKSRCKSRAEEITVPICTDCHDAVHHLFSNKQLEKDYNTVESLLGDERFSKHVKWLAKQDIGKRFKTKIANNQRNRYRNG
jgi:hypothetical protein